MDIKTLIIIFLVAFIIFQSVQSSKERSELIKMIAAKNYSEYKTLETPIENKSQSKHKNMIKSQQKKMFERKRE